MAPNNLYLIRHAQGFHNLGIENHAIRDPLLTPEGELQCTRLAKAIDNIQSIDCIVASPLRRALYTALITFREVLQAKPNMKIVALPELQETSSLPCDTGLPVDELRSEFKEQPIDFSLVPENWNDKLFGPFAPQTDFVSRRVEKARRFLQRRSEREVVVVTHGSLLHYLTEDWVGSLTGCGTGWSNCEVRTYSFDMRDPVSISNARIVETNISLARRPLVPQPLTLDRQFELQVAAQQSWAADGYIILADVTIAKDTTLETKTESAMLAEGTETPFRPENLAVEEGRNPCHSIRFML